MPLYTYKCQKCGLVFEEIARFEKRDEAPPCKLCQGASVRNAAETFSVNTTLNPKTDTIYSNKEIDKVVGAAAEKKWAGYDERWKGSYSERQKKRWKGKEPTVLDIPKDSDGKYSPVAHLGDSKQQAVRKEFSEALKEHRVEREKKGIPQFDAPGGIAEK
jgi:putative FmdB family regulatory protein